MSIASSEMFWCVCNHRQSTNTLCMDASMLDTATLYLQTEGLVGTIPTELGLLTNIGESITLRTRLQC